MALPILCPPHSGTALFCSWDQLWHRAEGWGCCAGSPCCSLTTPHRDPVLLQGSAGCRSDVGSPSPNPAPFSRWAHTCLQVLGFTTLNLCYSLSLATVIPTIMLQRALRKIKFLVLCFIHCCFDLHKSAAFLWLGSSSRLGGARLSQSVALGSRRGPGCVLLCLCSSRGVLGWWPLCVESSGKLLMLHVVLLFRKLSFIHKDNII